MNMPHPGYRLFLVTENFHVFSPYNRKKLLPINKNLVEEIWADTQGAGEDVKVWVDDRDLRAESVLFSRCTQLKPAA